jgi:hypothetical protein
VGGDVVSLLEDVCSNRHFQIFVVTRIRLEFAEEEIVPDRRLVAVQGCELRLEAGDKRSKRKVEKHGLT